MLTVYAVKAILKDVNVPLKVVVAFPRNADHLNLGIGQISVCYRELGKFAIPEDIDSCPETNFWREVVRCRDAKPPCEDVFLF